MLSVCLGEGSSATGFCCVSIGDGATTRGAFQVFVTSSLSFPNDIDVEKFDSLITSLRDINLTYTAMVEQGFAPADFGNKASSAIELCINAIEQRKTQVQAVSNPVSILPVSESNVSQVESDVSSSSTVEQVN